VPVLQHDVSKSPDSDDDSDTGGAGDAGGGTTNCVVVEGLLTLPKEGVLCKRGDGFPYTWRQRKFTLTMEGLSYATLDGESKSSFTIDPAMTVVELSTADCPGRKSRFAFKLFWNKGSFCIYLHANSFEERSAWISAIRDCQLGAGNADGGTAAGVQPLTLPLVGITDTSTLGSATDDNT